MGKNQRTCGPKLGLALLPILLAGCSQTLDTPEWRMLTTVRARARVETGDFGHARKILEKLAKTSEDPEAWVNLGLVELRRGKPEGAESCWETATQLDPTCTRAHYLLAHSYLRRALEIRAVPEPKDPHEAEHRAQSLLDHASRSLSSAVAASPHNAAVHRLLGTVSQELGQKARAEVAFREAERLDPVTRGASVRAWKLTEIVVPRPARPARTGELSVRFEKQVLGVRAHDLTMTDVNGDGRPDLLLLGTKSLLQNEGNDATGRVRWSEKQLGSHGIQRGALSVPLDGDEHSDLVSWTVERSTSRVWLVRGQQGLEMEPLFAVEGVVHQVVASDLEKDGDLDLVLAISARPGIQVWRNDGQARFELDPAPGFKSLPAVQALVCADLNADRWPDLVCVGEDGTVRLFARQPGKAFVEVTSVSGLAAEQAHSVESGDLDSDGDLDLVLAGESGLWAFTNVAAARFKRTGVYRVSQSSWRLENRRRIAAHASRLFDFDNDGLQDAVTLHRSAVEPRLATQAVTSLIEDTTPRPLAFRKAGLEAEGETQAGLCLWRNTGQGVFLEVTERVHLDEYELRFAPPVVADFDLDGDLDLAVVRADGWVQMLWNEGGNSNRRLLVELTSDRGPASVLGARLEIYTQDQVQSLVVREPHTWIGIGLHPRLDAVWIAWPTGRTESILDLDIPPDGRLRL